MTKKITLVTWYHGDLIDSNKKMLESVIDLNLIIFTDQSTNSNKESIQFVHRPIEWFESNQYFEKLGESIPRSISISKMFLLNDAKILDRFDSQYMYWLDFDQLMDLNTNKLNKLIVDCDCNDLMICVDNKPGQDPGSESHLIVNGYFFGGNKRIIGSMNEMYYPIMIDSLETNINLTEHQILTQLVNEQLVDEHIDYKFNIISCGDKYIYGIQTDKNKNINNVKTHLYVLTYNFPHQFEQLIESFSQGDDNFLTQPKKYLLNNSTDRETDHAYDVLCNKFNFEQIKKDNIGICGARQWIAEHFDQSDADYYIFFEDDMMLHNNNFGSKNGMVTWIQGLYWKTLNIVHSENYDFLKLSFEEVYGNNSVQWAWYNVPDNLRIQYFPEKPKKISRGLDPGAPLTKFTHIKQYQDMKYIEGEIYYCNWPMWMNHAGNKKIFLEPKYEHPYEQTWMSLGFQKHRENILKTACLLASPINHNRLHYYKVGERREN